MKFNFFYKININIRQLWALLWSKKRYKFYIEEKLKLFNFETVRNILDSQAFQQIISPIQVDIPKEKKLLIIAPHPDDEILGAAGLIIKAKKNNCHISIIFLTSGSFDESNIREREARLVCNKIGVDSVYFLRIPDGGIANIDVNKTSLQELVNKSCPDIISLPFIFDGHLDHIYTNKLISNVFIKNNKKIDFWAYQIYSSIPANVIVDITSIVEYKFNLMSMYKSQLENFDFINWNRGLNAWNSKLLESKKSKYAECYFVVPFDQYIELCNIFFDHESDLP